MASHSKSVCQRAGGEWPSELIAAVKGACTYPNIVNGEIVDGLCPKDPLGDVASSRVGVGVGTA